jgi:hypothetical protein
LRWIGPPATLVVAGVLVLLLLGGDDAQLTARTAGIALIGTGMVLAALLAFYAVGLSEDRARARGEESGPPVPGGRDPHHAEATDEPPTAGGHAGGVPTPPHARPGRRPPRRPPPRRRGHL